MTSGGARETGRDAYSAILIGAFAGMVAGFVRTPNGRRLCDSVALMFDDFALECDRLRQATGNARKSAAETWEELRPIADVFRRRVARRSATDDVNRWVPFERVDAGGDFMKYEH